MKRELNEQDVLNLLSGLKQSETNYPSELMDSRRDMFAKQIAAALVVINTAGGSGASSAGGSSAAGGGTSSTGASVATGVGSSVGTILETALVIAIVVEAGVATYIYRDKIVNFINSHLSPKTELVTNPPDDFNLPVTGDGIPTDISPTITETITGTPLPNVTVLPPSSPPQGNNETNPTTGSTQVNSTPTPDNGNNGLHLGQTKQPTNQPQSNSTTSGSGNNNGNGKKNK